MQISPTIIIVTAKSQFFEIFLNDHPTQRENAFEKRKQVSFNT